MVDNQMTLAERDVMEGLHIAKNYAEIYELKDAEADNENMIRLCRSDPSNFQLQIRTLGPINGPYKPGKPRNMLASVSVSLAELESMVEYAKASLQA